MAERLVLDWAYRMPTMAMAYGNLLVSPKASVVLSSRT